MGGEIEAFHQAYVSKPIDHTVPDFIGKLHTVPQHIQFLQMILHNKHISKEVRRGFLAICSESYRDKREPNDEALLVEKLNILRKNIHRCDTFVFEVCSLKFFECAWDQQTYQLKFKHIPHIPNLSWIVRVMLEGELMESLQHLYHLIANV